MAVILLAAASRLVKHPFNFTPMVAMALFSGCYLKKYWAAVLPILAMLVSDYFIGFYDWQVMASVYVSFILAFYIGRLLARHMAWYNVVLSAIASSVLFFLVTNFAVWAFFDWYPHTWSGLASCFTLALPFFRNSFFGDLIYSAIFFGVYELVILKMASKYLAKSNNSADGQLTC